MPNQVPFKLQCLTLSGPDALDFAQSQLTADVSALAQGRWTPAGWCDPKGRTLAVLLVAPEREAVRLALPEPLAGDVARRLTMFTIGRNVTISDPANLAPDRTADRGLPLAADPTRSLYSLERGETAAIDDWARWLRDDIEQQLAWLLPATSSRYLPQMLDLERQGGLSYRKGCWPGQEVVARVRYRGTIKRRVQPFDGNGLPPEPGADITVEGRSAVVLYAVTDEGPSDLHRGLAVVDAPADRAAAGTGA